MKKVLFFLLFLPYVINGYSQIDNNYKIKTDDPYAIRKLSFEFNSFAINYDATNIVSFGFGLGIKAKLKGNFDLFSNFYSDYPTPDLKASHWFMFDNYKHPYDNDVKTNITNNNYSTYDLGLSYIFSDQVRDENLLYGTNTLSDGSIIITNATEIKAKLRRVRKIRGGLLVVNKLARIKGASVNNTTI